MEIQNDILNYLFSNETKKLYYDNLSTVDTLQNLPHVETNYYFLTRLSTTFVLSLKMYIYLYLVILKFILQNTLEITI